MYDLLEQQFYGRGFVIAITLSFAFAAGTICLLWFTVPETTGQKLATVCGTIFMAAITVLTAIAAVQLGVAWFDKVQENLKKTKYRDGD